MPDPGFSPEDSRVEPTDRTAPSRDPPARTEDVLSPSVARESAAHAAASYPGAELLCNGSPQEILARILIGDPLGLSSRARVWLDQNGYLVDSNRLALRTLAHVAHSARRYRGKPDLHSWIELLLERSVRDLINEDREAERQGRAVEVDEIAPFAFVSDALGIDPKLARRACVIFNGMVEYDRKVFYATSVMGKSMHRHVSEGFGPPARAQAALQRVLLRLSSIDGMPGSAP
jgi:hypothetical protein